MEGEEDPPQKASLVGLEDPRVGLADLLVGLGDPQEPVVALVEAEVQAVLEDHLTVE